MCFFVISMCLTVLFSLEANNCERVNRERDYIKFILVMNSKSEIQISLRIVTDSLPTKILFLPLNSHLHLTLLESEKNKIHRQS